MPELTRREQFNRKGIPAKKWAFNNGFNYHVTLDILNGMKVAGPKGFKAQEINEAIDKYLAEG